MNSDGTLRLLLRTCLERRTSTTLFRQLFHQLDQKEPITKDSVFQILFSADNSGIFDPLQLLYISELSIYEFHSSCGLPSVLTILPKLSQQTHSNAILALSRNFTIALEQHQSLQGSDTNEPTQSLLQAPIINNFQAIISSTNSYIKTMISLHSVMSESLIMSISTYLQELAKSFKLYNENSESSSSTTIVYQQNENKLQNDVFNEFIVNLSKILQLVKSKNHTLPYLLENELNNLIPNSSSTSTSSLIGLNLNSSKTQQQQQQSSNSTRATRLIYMLNQMYSWNIHDDDFLKHFKLFLKGANNQIIATELVISSFDCLTLILSNQNNSTVSLNLWKGFILKKLPLLLIQLKPDNYKSVICKPISNLNPISLNLIRVNAGGDDLDEMFSAFPSTVTDIRHDFLKACISLKLIEPKAIIECLDKDAAGIDPSSIKTDDMLYDDNGNVVIVNEMLRVASDVNPEFIPLEDSGLMTFFGLIEKMEGTKHLEIATLIISLIEEFIIRDDSSHLRQLCLAIGLNPIALDYIVLQVSPQLIIQPIIKYLDDWKNDEEEMNFQDTYTDFGCIFLLLIFICRRYNIQPEDIKLKQNETSSSSSFCLQYMNNISVTHSVDSLDSTTNELLGEWITALFDAGGISDDLMRLSSAKQCFTLVPTIFQQALIACKRRILDLDTLRGGLEYFLQPFLLGTILGALSWLENYLWQNYRNLHDNDNEGNTGMVENNINNNNNENDSDLELVVQVIKTLVKPVDLSGEAPHIHKLVISICGPKIYNALSEYISPQVDSTNEAPNSQSSSSITNIIDDSLMNVFKPYVPGSSVSKNYTFGIRSINSNSIFDFLNTHKITPNYSNDGGIGIIGGQINDTDSGILSVLGVQLTSLVRWNLEVSQLQVPQIRVSSARDLQGNDSETSVELPFYDDALSDLVEYLGAKQVVLYYLSTIYNLQSINNENTNINHNNIVLDCTLNIITTLIITFDFKYDDDNRDNDSMEDGISIKEHYINELIGDTESSNPNKYDNDWFESYTKENSLRRKDTYLIKCLITIKDDYLLCHDIRKESEHLNLNQDLQLRSILLLSDRIAQYLKDY